MLIPGGDDLRSKLPQTNWHVIHVAVESDDLCLCNSPPSITAVLIHSSHSSGGGKDGQVTSCQR